MTGYHPSGARGSQTLGFLLQDTSRLMRRRFIAKTREDGLPLNQSEASVLQHVSRDEGVSQATLATQLDIEPITLVRLLDRLQEAGLIERRSHPTDRRAWMIFLTKEAQPIIDRIGTIRLAVRAEAIAGLSAERYQQLIQLLNEIRDNLMIEPKPSEIGTRKSAKR